MPQALVPQAQCASEVPTSQAACSGSTTQAGLLKRVHVHTIKRKAGGLDLDLEKGAVPALAGAGATVEGRQQSGQGCAFSSALKPMSAFQFRSGRRLSQIL